MSDAKIITPSQFAGGGDSIGSKIKIIEAKLDTVMLALTQLAQMNNGQKNMVNNQGLIMERCFAKVNVDVAEVVKAIIAENDALQAKAAETPEPMPESKL